MNFFRLVEISSDLGSIENSNVCLECNNSAKIDNHITPKDLLSNTENNDARTRIQSEPFPFCTSFSSSVVK